MYTYATAQEAFYSSLKHLRSYGQWVPGVNDPTSVGSRFGTRSRATLETLAFTFAIQDPRDRLLKSSKRPIDVAFAFSNLLWTLRGVKDAEPILFYNPRGDLFTVDGKHFAGALGARLIQGAQGDQLAEVARLLSADPTSRRAVVLFFDAADTRSRPRDTPCMISMHFMIRQDRLWCINCMRSQSALMVMPYDLILLTMLHEIVATRLRVECGPFVHSCNSFHIYEDEVDLLDAVCAEVGSDGVGAMEPVDDASPTAIETALLYEEQIRVSLSANSSSLVNLERSPLSPYWKQVLYVIQAGWKKGRGVDCSEVTRLIDPSFGKLLSQ
jgi:thymidylate synthase